LAKGTARSLESGTSTGEIFPTTGGGGVAGTAAAAEAFVVAPALAATAFGAAAAGLKHAATCAIVQRHFASRLNVCRAIS
jgi:hypothetical protein